MSHSSPLREHFRHLHIWFDLAVLAILYVIAAYLPLFKIVPLIATLELVSFFAFHLFAKRNRFYLQGFLGGLVSSTAVYLQVMDDQKFSQERDRELLVILFSALCAMLLECLLIIYVLSSSVPTLYYMPFLSQLAFFLAVMIYIARRSDAGHLWASSTATENSAAATAMRADIERLHDHPIVWKNVAKLSAIIVLIIALMHFIGNELELSRNFSTLIISLFEAHAVLVSTMVEWSVQPQSLEFLYLFFFILLGNTLSKCYLVIKGTNMAAKKLFVMLMLSGFVISIAATWLWFYFT